MLCRTIYQRPQTDIALNLKVVYSAAHGDVDAAPMKSCSDSDLQVFDLKAAAALRVSHTTGADGTRSCRVKLAQQSMHTCAPTRGPAGVAEPGSAPMDFHPPSVLVFLPSLVVEGLPRCVF